MKKTAPTHNDIEALLSTEAAEITQHLYKMLTLDKSDCDEVFQAGQKVLKSVGNLKACVLKNNQTGDFKSKSINLKQHEK